MNQNILVDVNLLLYATGSKSPIPVSPNGGKGISISKLPEESPKARPERAKLKVTFPDNTQICLPKVADTMVEVIRKIGFQKVQSLNIQMYGFPIVSNTRHEKYNWSDAGNGIYILTHSNTNTKISQLQKINNALKMGLKIEKV